jgi:hypothetical protein
MNKLASTWKKILCSEVPRGPEEIGANENTIFPGEDETLRRTRPREIENAVDYGTEGNRDMTFYPLILGAIVY